MEQSITKDRGNYDVIALMFNKNAIGIDILFIRNGLLLGNKSYFPVSHKFDLSSDEIMSSFLMQHYLQNEESIVVPDKILINIKLPNRLNISALLSEKFKRKIVVSDRIKSAQKHLITTAEANAINALKTHHASTAKYFEQLLNFKETLDLSILPRRIECFDVSHTMGEAQIASCVVFNESGPSKSDYRRFNIKTTNVGDDYAALREALSRRYRDRKNLPDVIMVDGGKGQLHVASQVLQQLQIDNVLLMAIAKGEARKPGLEEIYVAGKKDPLDLSPQSPTLYFIQQVRDEAHRFAISGHRKKMIKLRRQSILEKVPGVGKARQMILLKHFGGLAELQGAGIDDLTKVKGIGRDLARHIYAHLHAE
jgi:excinuclease ABC subunit C